MTGSIRTGNKVKRLNVTNDEYNSGVLLRQDDTQTQSRAFNVSKPTRIIAFGLSSGYIEVVRVLLPISETNVNVCTGVDGNPTQMEKDYRVGCEKIKLCPNQDEVMIDSKGNYRIIYSGEERENVHVIYQEDENVELNFHALGIARCCEDEVPIQA